MTYTLETKTGRGSELAAVARHPLRARAWLILMAGVASPKQIADQLAVRVQDVAYHVKALEKAGVVELVDKKPRRGATEHFYRCKQRLFLDREGTEALSEEDAMTNGIHVLQLIFVDMLMAIDEGTLVRSRDHHLARVPMLVDADGWGDMNAAAAEYLDRLLEIEAESAMRFQASGEEPISATGAAIAVETPDARHYRAT